MSKEGPIVGLTPESIALLVDGTLLPPGDCAEGLIGEFEHNSPSEFLDVAGVDRATNTDVTYIEKPKQVSRLNTSSAGVALVPKGAIDAAREQFSRWIIGVESPQDAFIQVMLALRPQPAREVTGISERATVSLSASVGINTNIHPGVVIGERVTIGENCEILPGVVIADDCSIGDGTIMHPNAVLYRGTQVGHRVLIHANAVIGADGFGYRFVDGAYVKIPHTGTVILEDDVEIGACTTIDRAMIGATRIGAGTKLDNLIMIGHNCELGKHNAFASQVGLAGSVTTGDYVRCAGQVGVADHLHLGEGCTIGPDAGVKDDVTPGEMWIGAPAIPAKQFYRQIVNQKKIPQIREQLDALSAQVQQLTEQLAIRDAEKRAA